METRRLEPFDRKRDPLEVLDPRIMAGRLKAIGKPRLVSMGESRFESQAELARQLGVARSTVTKWAKGQAPMSNRQVVGAAHRLDVSPFWLLGIVEDRSFDWHVPSMPPEQYERARQLRSEVASFVRDTTGGRLLDRFPADYRDPQQLLSDVVCWCAHERMRDEGHTPIVDVLLTRVCMVE